MKKIKMLIAAIFALALLFTVIGCSSAPSAPTVKETDPGAANDTNEPAPAGSEAPKTTEQAAESPSVLFEEPAYPPMTYVSDSMQLMPESEVIAGEAVCFWPELPYDVIARDGRSYGVSSNLSKGQWLSDFVNNKLYDFPEGITIEKVLRPRGESQDIPDSYAYQDSNGDLHFYHYGYEFLESVVHNVNGELVYWIVDYFNDTIVFFMRGGRLYLAVYSGEGEMLLEEAEVSIYMRDSEDSEPYAVDPETICWMRDPSKSGYHQDFYFNDGTIARGRSWSWKGEWPFGENSRITCYNEIILEKKQFKYYDRTTDTLLNHSFNVLFSRSGVNDELYIETTDNQLITLKMPVGHSVSDIRLGFYDRFGHSSIELIYVFVFENGDVYYQYVYNYPQGGIKELIRHDALSEVGAHIVDIGSIDSVIMDDGCIYVPENPEN